MDITPVIPQGSQVIDRYGNGGFVISGVSHKGSIFLLSSGVQPWDGHITAAALTPLVAEKPEIAIIGAGARFMPMPPELRDLFRSHGISVDIMDTGAACRTYSVLLAEGRAVAAALVVG